MRTVEELQTLLNWIWRWGYSSSAAIALLIGLKGCDVDSLVKTGLVTASRTESGMPTFYLTLTRRGLDEAQRRAESRLRYPELDRSRVNQDQIRHYLLAQSITARALTSGGVSGYLTERQFDGDGDLPGIKRPDVIWVLPSGRQIGIEIELTPKWGRQLDQFVLGVAWSLASSLTTSGRFERVVVVADAIDIIDRYKRAMRPGANLDLWKKDSFKKWEIVNTVKVPAWLIKKVHFELMEAA